MAFTRLDLGGPVATLCLDHPEGNRINFDMRVELRDAVQRVARSSSRALLIRGEGADFCRGGDVRDWPGMSSKELRSKIEVFAEALEHLGAAGNSHNRVGTGRVHGWWLRACTELRSDRRCKIRSLCVPRSSPRNSDPTGWHDADCRKGWPRQGC
jgi:hypothetical protein